LEKTGPFYNPIGGTDALKVDLQKVKKSSINTLCSGRAINNKDGLLNSSFFVKSRSPGQSRIIARKTKRAELKQVWRV